MQTNSRTNNFLVFDYETGGKDPKKNPTVEFAGIWLDSTTFEEIDRYESVIAPYDDKLEVEDKSIEIHGISREEIVKGKPLDEVVGQIVARTINCNKDKMKTKKTVLVGQNIMFDIGFLQQNFKYCKQDLNKIFDCTKDYFGNPIPTYIDTLPLGRTKHSPDLDKTRFGLSDLCSYEHIDLTDSHRAMPDVESTVELFIAYMKSLRSGGNSETYSYRKNFKFQIA